MAQDVGIDGQDVGLSLSDRLAVLHCIPVNDEGGDPVEPSQAIMLPFDGAATDFALAADAKPVLVQARVGTALQFGVEQPVYDKKGSFHPSDFAESDGQFRTITSCRILALVNPINGFGTRLVSKNAAVRTAGPVWKRLIKGGLCRRYIRRFR